MKETIIRELRERPKVIGGLFTASVVLTNSMELLVMLSHDTHPGP
ncbi:MULTISPECIES: hypothetical protein [Halorussus]|nr:hypothetical protein [Halorussus vallis]